ncbi:TPM domain-containing protein [Winogradskyella thalassocola]|uniref:TPM domain-containing protein n=1 Tax=Winogradskyella thalassocola TaxID=262004 RepID=A0A1G8GTI6_9FLAO|nr:TPM domain-containing protein [Winogradskyella thalassocola]SDH97679.1 uncharacterized protein SAMN04489796_10624 [Winogradskyella thalassocola]
MRLKFFFQLTMVCILFLNCKETKTDIETVPSYIPLNPSQERVVDLANLFSNAESDSLAYKIIGYEKRTTNQIAILTIDSLPPNTTIQHFGTEVGENWGVGTKEKDNGLLITISNHDRKIAISTGIGTEQTISDYECKVIIDSIMIPPFRTNNYYKGVDKALDSIMLLWD